MLYDLKEIKSHPDKYLLTLDRKEIGHTEGVIDNVSKITDSKYTILIAFFHDIGKLNPNFQKKLPNDSKKVKEYSNHAYLSAFIFFVFFRCNRYNFQLLAKYLNDNLLCENALLSIIIQIAKHHGNLPDFSTPNNYK
jgi:CRISPR-associated endonuclease Cas3-HD